ncbi:MAG: polysaccharide biosynthesis protein [candidate division Zixibacteria bacterium]|nr:polysaccharide biosynthesis protein [candidate division Zixibacteria bacterium]
MKSLRTLISGAFVYGIGDVMLFGIGYLVMIPLLTHYLTPEQYGIVATLNMLSVFLVAILQVGLPSAAFRFWYLQKSAESRKSYMAGIGVMSVTLAAGLAFVLLGFGRPLWEAAMPHASFGTFAPYIVWGAVLQVVIGYKSVLLRALDRSRWFITLDVLQFITMLVAVWYQVAVLSGGVEGQIKGVFYTQAVFAVISGSIVFGICGLHMPRTDVARSLFFAVPVFVTGIVSLLATRSTVLIAQRYVAGAEVGLLALGMQIGYLLQLGAGSFEKAWQPFLYSRDPERARMSLRAILRLAAPAFTIAAMTLALFAPEIIHVASSPDYAEAWGIVGIAAFGALCAALSSIANGGLYYATRSGASLVVTSTAAAANLVLCWFLIPQWGIAGAAMAMALSAVVSLTFMFIAVRKIFDRGLGVAPVFGTICLGLTLTVIVFKVCSLAAGHLWLVWTCKLSGIAIYVLAIWRPMCYPALTELLRSSHDRVTEVEATRMLSTKRT